MTSEAPSRRWLLPAFLVLWAAFAAFCASGFPPAVDLAAHGAQEETLVSWLRGEDAVRAVYGVHLPWGYGLPYALFLPLAFATNGAVAVRCALWVALMLFPLSLLALTRALKRSEGVILLGLPFAFNFSYWYGLLSGLFAQPLALFTLARFLRALSAPRFRNLLWVNLLAAATFQSHLLAFAALAVAMAAVALVERPLWPSLRTLVSCMGLPALLSVPKVFAMASRAITPGPWPATEYNALSHLNWFFKTYGPEGKLAVLGPLLTVLFFVGAWLGRRKREPKAPAAAFLALAALYVLTPKTLSGIFLVSVRLPALWGLCALMMVDFKAFPRTLGVGLGSLALASLVETATFHARFAQEMSGLAQVLSGGPPGRSGYVRLGDSRVLGSKHIYLEHMGQWLTATHGGVGQDFFTDAEHHPVHALPGQEPPRDLQALLASDRAIFDAHFDTLIVHGNGPLPPSLAGFREKTHVNAWRRLERRQAGTGPTSSNPDPSR